MKRCRVSGCTRVAKGWGVYCDNHKAIDRRHGHPCQTGISKADLAPYVMRVRARIRKNKANGAWDRLTTLWCAAGCAWGEFLEGVSRGQPSQVAERRAAEAMHRVYLDTKPSEVIETALAVFLMQDHRPRLFQGDRAFRFQLARRVMRLTDMNAGLSYNPKTGRDTRYYREMTPAAMEQIGKDLEAIFGLAGLRIAGLERKEREAITAREDGLQADLGALR